MGNLGKVLLSFAATLSATSCSYGYRIYAAYEGGSLVFRTDARESRWHAGLCLDYLEVRSSGARVWRIERIERRPIPDCPNDFPITYGRVPAGFRATTGAATLRQNQLYELDGHGSAHFDGSFRYSIRRTIVLENSRPL